MNIIHLHKKHVQILIRLAFLKPLVSKLYEFKLLVFQFLAFKFLVFKFLVLKLFAFKLSVLHLNYDLFDHNYSVTEKHANM